MDEMFSFITEIAVLGNCFQIVGLHVQCLRRWSIPKTPYHAMPYYIRPPLTPISFPLPYPSQLPQLLCQLRHHHKQIPHQPHICHLKDRRIPILINRRNNLTIFHPRQMLNRPRYPRTQIQLRRHVLSGLPHLKTVVRKPAVDGGTGGADRGPESVCKGRNQSLKFCFGL